MSDPVERLATAEAQAVTARAALSKTMQTLQERLSPRALAGTAAREMADAGHAAAIAGVETVRRNPGALAGVVAFAGLFLARHRIAGLLGRKPPGATGDGPTS